MRRATFLCVVLACVGWIEALGAEPITIRGRIVDPQGGGAAGVELELFPELSRYEAARLEAEPRELEPAAVAVSSADGSFRLAAPEAGFWRLVASAPGMLPAAFRFIGEPLLEPTALEVLHLEAASSSRILVRDAAGQPAAGAVIRASKDEGPIRRQRRSSRWHADHTLVRTDAAGSATVLRASGSDLAVAAWLTGHVNQAPEPGRSASLTLDLERGIARRVRVLDGDGSARAGIVLRLDGWTVALTDDAGLAAIHPAPGDTDLELILPDGRRLERQLAADDGLEEAFAVRVPAAQSASGLVLDAVDRRPIDGAFVTPGGDVGRTVRTDARGGFDALTGETDRGLSVVAQGYLRQSEPLSDSAAPRAVQLARAVNLVGRVQNEQGEPIAEARVETAPDPQDMMFGQSSGRFTDTTTDLAGDYVLNRVAAVGRILVTASKQGYAPNEQVVRDPVAAAAAGGLDFVLDRGASAFGQVVAPDGGGIAGAELVLEREYPASVRQLRGLGADRLHTDRFEASSGADGAFSLNGLPPGRYSLEAAAAGYARQLVLGLEVRAASGASDLGTITLEPGVALRGRLIDPDGLPVAGGRVQASEDDGPRGRRTNAQLSRTAADDGSFVFEDRREGEELSFYIDADGFVTKRVPRVAVEAGKTIEIALVPAVAIRGRVLTPDGQPASEALVEVARESGARSYGEHVRRHWQRSRADELGRFELVDVEPGEVRLAAEAADWLRVELGNIVVPADRDLEEVEITLRRGAQLEGRVIGPDGRTVQDARISLESQARRRQRTLTDGDGYYRIGAVEEGRQVVTAHDQEAGLSATEEVTVEAGVNRLDFFLTAGVAVSGRVLTTRGVAVEDALIQAMPAGAFTGSVSSARSGADGSFRLDNVRPGTHRLEVAHSDFVLVSPVEPLEVGEQPVLGLEVRMSAGSAITGLISGLDPYLLATTRVQATSDSAWAEGLVATDGSYRIANVAPGDWVVIAITGDGRREQASVEVADGAAEVTVDLDFDDGLVLNGVVLRDGEPQSGFAVWATGNDVDVSAHGSTDYEGRFELRGLEAGTYTLRVSSYATGLGHSETLVLRRDEEITIELEGSTVSGVVVTADDGAPIAGALVRLQPVDQDDSYRSRFAQGTAGDQSGRFALHDIAAGSYRLSVSRPGYATYDEALDIASGELITGLEIELKKAAGLAYQVVSHLGTPVRSLDWAVLDPAGTAHASGTEQATSTGRVRLTTVPDGPWTLLVAVEGSAVLSQAVRAPAEEATLQLEPAARVTVRVGELNDEPSRAVLTVLSVTGERFRSLSWGARLTDEWVLFNGRALIDDLPAGRWIFTVRASDGRRWSQAVTLDAGSHEVVVD